MKIGHFVYFLTRNLVVFEILKSELSCASYRHFPVSRYAQIPNMYDLIFNDLILSNFDENHNIGR